MITITRTRLLPMLLFLGLGLLIGGCNEELTDEQINALLQPGGGPPPPASMTVTPTGGLSTTEALNQATFTVVLDIAPTADVTISLTSSNTAEGTVSPATLTFTVANWSTPQTVTVTGVDDGVQDGNVAYMIITGLATSTDPTYDGKKPPDVSLINVDDDKSATIATSFADASGITPMGVAWDGTFYYSARAGCSTCGVIARYFSDGTLDTVFSPGPDFRALFTDNAGNLYAKEYGNPAAFYTVTPGGVTAWIYDLAQTQFQSAAGFSGDDSEIYTHNAGVITRHSSADGSTLGTFTLQGMTAAEKSSQYGAEVATTVDGRLFTYYNGVVSEWDLTGRRIAMTQVPIATPTNGSTIYSFSIANGMIFLLDMNTSVWEGYAF